MGGGGAIHLKAHLFHSTLNTLTLIYTCNQVPLPEDFMQGAITTDDINDLPNTPAASNFKKDVANKLKSYTSQMKLGQKPT